MEDIPIKEPNAQRSKSNFVAMIILFGLSIVLIAILAYLAVQYFQINNSPEQIKGLGLIFFGFFLLIGCIILSPILIVAFALLINIRSFDKTRVSSPEYVHHYYKKALSFGVGSLVLSLVLTVLVFVVLDSSNLFSLPLALSAIHILIWSLVYIGRATTAKNSQQKTAIQTLDANN